MAIEVVKPGALTLVQAGPRTGRRHQGVPASGAADPLSLALANRLVGNDLLAPALEIALTGPTLRFESATAFAVTGAQAALRLNDRDIGFHETIEARAGDQLTIGSVELGARVYLAVAGGIEIASVLGSASTYLPAGFGGFDGRALREGDVLQTSSVDRLTESLKTPDNFRPPITSRWALRTCRSAETNLLVAGQLSRLFDTTWTVGLRADRMGLQLEGSILESASDGRLPSAPVFPGTIQCPEDGHPFLLSVDAQTTGGYPRVAQIARADRHLIGQMRPGDHLLLLPRQPADALAELRAKHDYWRQWLDGIERVI